MQVRSILVYVVDDDPSVRTAYARLLSSAQMISKAFGSVQELMESGLSGTPDCVISDIRMNECNGLELPAMLAAADRAWPVIFVTAFDTPEAREQARRCHAAAYFRKPVDAEALIDAIRWAVDRAR